MNGLALIVRGDSTLIHTAVHLYTWYISPKKIHRYDSTRRPLHIYIFRLFYTRATLRHIEYFPKQCSCVWTFASDCMCTPWLSVGEKLKNVVCCFGLFGLLAFWIFSAYRGCFDLGSIFFKQIFWGIQFHKKILYVDQFWFINPHFSLKKLAVGETCLQSSSHDQMCEPGPSIPVFFNLFKMIEPYNFSGPRKVILFVPKIWAKLQHTTLAQATLLLCLAMFLVYFFLFFVFWLFYFCE